MPHHDDEPTPPDLDVDLAGLIDDIQHIVDYYYHGPNHDIRTCDDDDCVLCAYVRYHDRVDDPVDYYTGRDDGPGHNH